MDRRIKTILFISIIMIFPVIMSACGGNAATPEPTQDISVFSTQAALTIEARFTETAAAMPTDTPEPTYTPVSIPTEASDVSVLPTADSSAVNIISVPTVTSEGAIAAIPTATTAAEDSTTASAGTAGDKASYDSQNPVDNTHFSAGESFDASWTLVNTGTTTWTTDYSLRYYTGENFCKPGKTRYYLTSSVAPGETGTIVIDAVAPSSSGTYKMAMVLGNESDINFSVVDLTIIVD